VIPQGLADVVHRRVGIGYACFSAAVQQSGVPIGSSGQVLRRLSEKSTITSYLHAAIECPARAWIDPNDR
jgi:hypothetical protein